MEDLNNKGRSLSELPEHVLSHILSFLPTKEAVRVSVLSKRWECIWTSIPKLLFSRGEASPKDYVNIVNRSLRLRRSFDITSFSLRLADLSEDLVIMSQIEAWISDVVRFNVQDVELDITCDSPLTLPLSFVNCRTLTSLTIDVEGILKFPSRVCFSNLRKLELNNVIFIDEHSTQKLFSGCPMLEDLKLQECGWEGVKAVSVASPRLRYFTMIEDKGPFTANYNGGVFVIFGGAFKYFHYQGQFQFDFNILNSQLLEVVVINFYSHLNDPILVMDHFLKLLRYTSNVPNLILMDASCLLDIPEVSIHMPMFNGVRHLELDDELSDLSNTGLLKMLQNMPRLESLVFSEDGILEPLPPCFLSHLHFIHILIKKGDVKDLMGVKVLLKNAMVLEEMAIQFSELVNDDNRNNFCLELLKLPRGSRDCGIYTRKLL